MLLPPAPGPGRRRPQIPPRLIRRGMAAGDEIRKTRRQQRSRNEGFPSYPHALKSTRQSQALFAMSPIFKRFKKVGSYLLAATFLAGTASFAASLQERMNEYESKNPMPDPAPHPFSDMSQAPEWIQRCTLAQAAYNRWDAERFEYGIKGRSVFFQAGARNSYAEQIAKTNSPSATCGCLAQSRIRALNEMSIEAADSLINYQYEQCRRR